MIMSSDAPPDVCGRLACQWEGKKWAIKRWPKVKPEGEARVDGNSSQRTTLDVSYTILPLPILSFLAISRIRSAAVEKWPPREPQTTPSLSSLCGSGGCKKSHPDELRHMGPP